MPTILNTTFFEELTPEEKAEIAPHSNMDFADFMSWHMKLFAIMCLVSIGVTQFACAKPVPAHSSYEYLDLV